MKYVAVLKVEDVTRVYNSFDIDTHKHEPYKSLFDIFNCDVEEGKEVNVCVLADDSNNLYDVLLNGESAGYYFLKLVVSLNPEFKLPEVVHLGHDSGNIINRLIAKHKDVYVLPMFGDLQCM